MANRTRQFSWNRPLLYHGSLFPTATMPVEDSKGNIADTSVFADANGMYHSLDQNGNELPVILQHTLPEVTVTAPRKTIVDIANDYYTQSNDNTQVLDSPHSEYNPHLKDNALRGAESNAQWEKEHPNASSWMYALNAAPFAVAAAPAAITAGQSLASTSLGQAAINGVSRLMTNPLMEMANTGLGLGFAAKGTNDVIHGKFTPETALELMPLVQMANKAKLVFKFPQKQEKFLQNIGNNTSSGSPNFKFIEDPLQMHIKRARANGYDTSDIRILNLSENTPENTAFFNSTAQKFQMKPEEVKNELLSIMGTHGHASVPEWEKVIIHDGKIGENTSAVLSHELDHLLHFPQEPVPDNVFYPRLYNLYGNEFYKHNNTEIAARGSQLHDYFGHTNTEPITEGMLKYARDNYVKDVGLNNDMNEILWSTKNYKELADWMTKYSTGIIPFGVMGTIYNNNKK